MNIIKQGIFQGFLEYNRSPFESEAIGIALYFTLQTVSIVTLGDILISSYCKDTFQMPKISSFIGLTGETAPHLNTEELLAGLAGFTFGNCFHTLIGT
jgi:hypothetical protein